MKYTDIAKRHFKCLPKDLTKKCEVWQCKYCQKEMAYQVSRMLDHLEKCKQAPENLKQTLKNDTNRKRKSSNAVNDSSAPKNLCLDIDGEKEETEIERTVEKASVQINHYLDKMSSTEQSSLRKLFAKAVYTSGENLLMNFFSMKT